MPHEGYDDPIMNDGPRLHSNVPVSELTEHVTRAIEASDVSSAPPVARNRRWGNAQNSTDPYQSPMGLWGSSRPTLTQESDRPRFEGWPAKGSRPPRVK